MIGPNDSWRRTALPRAIRCIRNCFFSNPQHSPSGPSSSPKIMGGGQENTAQEPSFKSLDDANCKTRVIISQSLGECLLEECREVLDGQAFMEIGGAIVGNYDGNNWCISRFVRDTAANASSASIRFSPYFFLDVHHAVSKENESVLGTWHLHPSGFGTQFSEIDYRCAFNDHHLLSIGIPTVQTPKCHLIFDLYDLEKTSAYTSKLGVEYELNEIESPDQDLSGFGCSMRPKTFFLQQAKHETSLIPYGEISDEMEEQNTIIGFYRTLNSSEYTDEGLRSILLENYYLKTGQEQFIYVEHPRDRSIKCYQVVRKGKIENSRIIEYPKVGIKWKEDTAQMDKNKDQVTLTVSVNTGINLSNAEKHHYPADMIVADVVNDISKKKGGSSASWLAICYPRSEIDIKKDYPNLPVFDQAVGAPEDWTLAELNKRLTYEELPTLYLKQLNPNGDEIYHSRTSRMSLAGYPIDQMKTARVLIGGMGIVGCEIAEGLAVCGVGEFVTVDRGRVDWVNLRRQSLYDQSHVYQRKAEAAAAVLNSFGGVAAEGLDIFVPAARGANQNPMAIEPFMDSWVKLAEKVEKSDLAYGVFDEASTRMTLQALCRFYDKPLISAGVDMTLGRLQSFPVDGWCYGCLSGPRVPLPYNACTSARLDVKNVTAAHALRLGIDYLSGKEMPALDIQINPRDLSPRTEIFCNTEECWLCGKGGILASAGDDLEKLGLMMHKAYFEFVSQNQKDSSEKEPKDEVQQSEM